MYLTYTRALCNVRYIEVIENKGITYFFLFYLYTFNLNFVVVNVKIL